MGEGEGGGEVQIKSGTEGPKCQFQTDLSRVQLLAGPIERDWRNAEK